MWQKTKILTFFLTLILSLNCAAQSKYTDSKTLATCRNLTLPDAEKILGQPARLVESKVENKDDSHISRCKYTAVSKTQASGPEINLYFMLEETPSEEHAKQIYAGIWQSNKNHAGIEKLNDFGSEGFAQTDKPNFHFIMVRKGRFTVRLKVNKAVETTSFDEVKMFMQKIIKEI